MKVRIKLLVDASGKYCGYGYHEMGDTDQDDTLYDAVGIDGGPVQEYWLTADVPLPGAPAIAAVVQPA